MSREVQLPAPGRGSYDRSLTRLERDQEHRERLLRATGELFTTNPLMPLTVARIVQHAGVGRSTFYEFFDSPEHLLTKLEQRATSQIEAALQAAFVDARTPLERVRAISRRYVSAFEIAATAARVVLTLRRGNGILTVAGEQLHVALERCVAGARADGAWFKTTDDLYVLAAAAAGEALCRRHLFQSRLDDAPRVLAELLIKILR